MWIVQKNLSKRLDEVDEIIYTLTQEDSILFYNYNQIYNSNRQIFSLKENFLFAKQILYENPNFVNLSKKRMG